MKNRMKIFILFDSILLNLFDMLEDQKKTKVVVYNTNSDISKERMILLSIIKNMTQMLENAFVSHNKL